jgi:hypothetical protein
MIRKIERCAGKRRTFRRRGIPLRKRLLGPLRFHDRARRRHIDSRKLRNALRRGRRNGHHGSSGGKRQNGRPKAFTVVRGHENLDLRML